MQYTTAQMLHIVEISRRTLQTWISSGKLKKSGGQGSGRFWDATDIKLLLDIKQQSVRGPKPRN